MPVVKIRPLVLNWSISYFSITAHNSKSWKHANGTPLKYFVAHLQIPPSFWKMISPPPSSPSCFFQLNPGVWLSCRVRKTDPTLKVSKRTLRKHFYGHSMGRYSASLAEPLEYWGHMFHCYLLSGLGVFWHYLCFAFLISLFTWPWQKFFFFLTLV